MRPNKRSQIYGSVRILKPFRLKYFADAAPGCLAELARHTYQAGSRLVEAALKIAFATRAWIRFVKSSRSADVNELGITS